MAILIRDLRQFIDGQADERVVDIAIAGVGTTIQFVKELGTCLTITVNVPYGFELVQKPLANYALGAWVE